jgi:hypothetical protein
MSFHLHPAPSRDLLLRIRRVRLGLCVDVGRILDFSFGLSNRDSFPPMPRPSSPSPSLLVLSFGSPSLQDVDLSPCISHSSQFGYHAWRFGTAQNLSDPNNSKTFSLITIIADLDMRLGMRLGIGLIIGLSIGLSLVPSVIVILCKLRFALVPPRFLLPSCRRLLSAPVVVVKE